MFSQKIAMASLATVLAITPLSRAVADGGDLMGGIIGGIIGGAIVNESQKKRTTTTVRRSTTSSATRNANRETQVALNYFGYPAGTPDGVMGRKSRNAAASYQAALNFPVTGQLNPYERDFLVQSYYRAQANPMEASHFASQSPMGMRGVLTAYRNQETGFHQPQTAAAPSAAPTAPATTLAAAPQVTEDAAALPNFFATEGAGAASLASHCNTVSLLTNTNGGFTTLASMSDPQAALGEQFCLARTYAISQGEEAAAALQNVSMSDMEARCGQFAPAMKSQISALSLKQAPAVLQDVSAFILQTGMSPAQLAGSAKVCLSVGYRTDNMDVALGSALLLTALGQQAYGELLGHHLSQGFGTSKRADLSLGWYELGLASVQNGGAAVFAPGQAERTDLIRQAAYQINGQQNPSTGAAVVQPVSILPTFDLGGTNN